MQDTLFLLQQQLSSFVCATTKKAEPRFVYEHLASWLGLMPVSRSVPFRAFTSAPSEGWEVAPDMLSMQQSMMSAPAWAQASWVATPVPAVSCVCTCMGMSGNCFLHSQERHKQQTCSV